MRGRLAGLKVRVGCVPIPAAADVPIIKSATRAMFISYSRGSVSKARRVHTGAAATSFEGLGAFTMHSASRTACSHVIGSRARWVVEAEFARKFGRDAKSGTPSLRVPPKIQPQILRLPDKLESVVKALLHQVEEAGGGVGQFVFKEGDFEGTFGGFQLDQRELQQHVSKSGLTCHPREWQDSCVQVAQAMVDRKTIATRHQKRNTFWRRHGECTLGG